MEPKTIQAGDSITWSISDSRYTAANGWAVSYVLVSPTKQLTIAGVDNGSGGFNITATGAVTRLWPANTYDFRAYATKGDDRHTLRTGQIQILPDLERQTSGFDSRTPAQKYIDALLAARSRLAEGAHRVTVASESVGGRSRSYRTLEELDAAIRRAERDVNMETRRKRALAGLGHHGNIKVAL